MFLIFIKHLPSGSTQLIAEAKKLAACVSLLWQVGPLFPVGRTMIQAENPSLDKTHPTGKSRLFFFFFRSCQPSYFSLMIVELTTHSRTMFTRNRLTRPFTGDVSWLLGLVKKTKGRRTKSRSPLPPGFDAASRPFCAVTASSLLIDLRTWALRSLATFCLCVAGSHFACGSRIRDIPRPAPATRYRSALFARPPCSLLEELLLGAASCSPT